MRLKQKHVAYLLALTLLPGAGCYADSLNGAGTWQSWNSSSLVVDSSSPGIGTPYWNNTSGDGSRANVGWCLTGGGNCTMPAGTPGTLAYFGNGSSSVGSMYFTSTGNPVTVSLQTVSTTQMSIANGYDIFGYYIANGGSAASATLVPLFSSLSSSLGSSITLPSLAAGTTYGFYIENVQGSGGPFQTNYIFTMDSASNMATGSMPADSLQHFAAFNNGNGSYFLGDVDTDSCQGNFHYGTSPCNPASQFDYNDMIVELSTSGGSSTPEPASLALMGGGLCLIGALLRRKKPSIREN